MPLVDNAGTNTCVIYYPNDQLAEMISQAWIDPDFHQRLLNDTAQVFKERNILVDNPLVVTESQFQSTRYPKDQYTLFVLPDTPKGSQFSKSIAQGNLLHTARIKMAYTCCGI